MYEKLVSTDMITKANITLGGHILTIAADADAKALDAFNFATEDEGTVKVLGTQNVADDENAKPGYVLVADGATLNVSVALNMVENRGIVNLESNDETNIINFIANYNTLNVNANSNIKLLYNHNTVNNSAALSLGTMWGVGGYNMGTINNNGVFSSSNGFENKAAQSDKCPADQDGIKHGKGVIKNAGKVLNIVNEGLVEMMSAEARAEVTGTVNGEIDNTKQSAYVKGGNNTIFVKVDGSVKASEMAALVVNAGATKIKVSGTITVDPVGTATVVEVAATAIEATADLTIVGSKAGVKLNAASAALTVGKNVEVLIKNGAGLVVASHAGSADGGSVLTIQTGATFEGGTKGANITVEDYR